MSIFSDAEIGYLTSQPIARLATVDADGTPHVTPVGVFYDADDGSVIVAGYAGTGMATSKKFRDAQARPEVAYVVDDLAATDPWTPRGIEIRGRAEIVLEGGKELGERVSATMPFDPAFIRIHARRVLSWGIEPDTSELIARDV